jgi:type I restriction enzyme S subunit
VSDSLPVGWCAAPIADCVISVESLDPASRPDDEFTYCDISAIDNELGKVVTPKLLKGRDAPSRARQSVRAGDVLFSTVRPGLRAIARVPDAAKPVASTGFCVLRAAQGVDGAYLYQLARSDQFLQKVWRCWR